MQRDILRKEMLNILNSINI